jgi:lipopolysaccharide cholinephosphotransferase
MREITDEEAKKLQKCELEILIEFDRVARKNNLKYILDGGTLLGAIRHKGFIPWDDDIDIGMPRDDYEKFRKIWKKEIDTKRFFFQDMDNTDNFGVIFGKLRMKNTLLVEETSILKKKDQAIWIDIFPWDKASNDIKEARRDLMKGYIYKLIYYLKCGNKLIEHTFTRKVAAGVLKFMSFFYSKERCKNKLNKLFHKYDSVDTYRIVGYGGTYFFKEICDINYYDDLIEGEFEKKKFFIPKDYDYYLTHLYGDYMTLPPEEKRKSHHEIVEIKFPK